MSTFTPTYDIPALGDRASERDARGLLGRVMGYVAATLGFAALGAYLGRDLSGGAGLLFFVGTFAAIVGLNVLWALLGPIVFGIVAISSRSPAATSSTPPRGSRSSAGSRSSTSTGCVTRMRTAPS